MDEEPAPGPAPAVDDTLQLYFLCAHPSLTPSSAVALALRAVSRLSHPPDRPGLPCARGDHGAAHRRAKRTVSGVRFDQPGDVATVLRVLYLVFNEGYSGDVDLVAEAIRLTGSSQPRSTTQRWLGCSASCCSTTPGAPARTASDGGLVPLAEQDRGRWDTESIAEGVEILPAALARDRLGEFQARPPSRRSTPTRAPPETDWVQIVEWYDELARLTDSPVVRLEPRGGRRRGRRTARRPGRARGSGRHAAPPHRGGGLPPRAGRRPDRGGTAVHRGGPKRPPTSPNATT